MRCYVIDLPDAAARYSITFSSNGSTALCHVTIAIALYGLHQLLAGAAPYSTRPYADHPYRRAAATTSWTPGSPNSPIPWAHHRRPIGRRQRISSRKRSAIGTGGHTLLIASINSHLLTSLMSTTPYDPIKDFAPIGAIDSSDYLMVVHPAVPVSSLQEFIALAKAKPGQLNYASSTTSVLVTTAMFTARTGIKLQHVPYKGAGPALNDLLGGHVQMFFSTPSTGGARQERKGQTACGDCVNAVARAAQRAHVSPNRASPTST